MAVVPPLRLLSPEADFGSGRRNLVCFPFAGGSAETFWPLARNLPQDVAVYGVQYPRAEDGRANGRRWQDVVAAFADQTGALDGPMAFFGHSLGGTVAYETARELERRGGARPRLLTVSASAPPDHRSTRGHLRLESEAVARLPEGLRRRARFLDHYLGGLRTDLALLSDYDEVPEPRLAAPIVVFGGKHDDHVAAPILRHWAERTTGLTRVQLFDGGHFFLWDHLPEMMSILVTAWESEQEATAPAPAH